MEDTVFPMYAYIDDYEMIITYSVEKNST